jgi:spermidine/putrescine transport system substrate-binding protein
MAWSGDVFALALDDPDLRFVVPDTGAMKWTDNMCIPNGAEHRADAHAYMDFVYREDIAQMITEWVWYESPVAATQERIADHARETGDPLLQDLATSNLVFPTEEVNQQLYGLKVLDEEEEQEWLDLFQAVSQG